MAIDLVLKNNDLLIENGDFVFGESNGQDQEDILIYAPGELKQYPNVGVNMTARQDGPVNSSQLSQIIKQALQGDGFIVNNVSITNNGDNYNIKTYAVRS